MMLKGGPHFSLVKPDIVTVNNLMLFLHSDDLQDICLIRTTLWPPWVWLLCLQANWLRQPTVMARSCFYLSASLMDVKRVR